MYKGIFYTAFGGLVTFEMRLPSVRVDRERMKWFDQLCEAGLLPALGKIKGIHMPEVKLAQLMATTMGVQVEPCDNEALQGLVAFWTLAQSTDSSDMEAVKRLHEAFLDLFTPIVDQWWKASQSSEKATISRDPIRLPLEALAEEEKAEAAQPDSPLAANANAG